MDVRISKCTWVHNFKLYSTILTFSFILSINYINIKPRSLVGNDMQNNNLTMLQSKFQSTPRVGSDANIIANIPLASPISTRAPTLGTPASTIRVGRCLYISTHAPCRERRDGFNPQLVICNISIHAPALGATCTSC